MSDLGEDDRKILHYLHKQAERGDRYFRAKQIADAVDLSAKQVGARLAKLKDSAEGLKIEPWSRSRSTTWYVQPQ